MHIQNNAKNNNDQTLTQHHSGTGQNSMQGCRSCTQSGPQNDQSKCGQTPCVIVHDEYTTMTCTTVQIVGIKKVKIIIPMISLTTACSHVVTIQWCYKGFQLIMRTKNKPLHSMCTNYSECLTYNKMIGQLDFHVSMLAVLDIMMS